VERGNFQAYVASLERIMQNTHFDLREAMDQFRQLYLMISAERTVPIGIISDIRQTYKQIQEQLTKIMGVKQLLESKYRQYYHRDSQREREIMEFAFLAKSLYFKFEYRLQEIEAKRKLGDKGEYSEAYRERMPFAWFQSKGNQIILLRNLRSLSELDYKTQSDLECEQKRVIIRNGMRSVDLFVLSGEVELVDNLQSRMRLREYDITERYTEDEFRGALTHLKEISLSEVDGVIRRLTDSREFLKMKCLLLRVRSQKDLKKETVGSTENILGVMGAGEVKTLSI